MWGSSAVSTQPGCLPLLLEAALAPTPSWTHQSAKPAMAMAEPAHSSPGTHDWGPGSAAWGPGPRAGLRVRPWWACMHAHGCPRRAERGCRHSRLVRRTLPQTPGMGSSLHAALCFPGRPVPAVSSLTGQTSKAAGVTGARNPLHSMVRPAPERQRFQGEHGGWQLGSVHLRQKASAFPGHRGQERELARSQQRCCPGTQQMEPAPHSGEARACTPAGNVKAQR